MEVYGGAVLTHWTGEDEAEGVGHPTIVVLVFVTVDYKCEWS